MLKISKIPLAFTTVLVALSLATAPALVYAEDSSTSGPAAVSDNSSGSHSGSSQDRNSGQGENSTHFSGLKLQLCQKRQAKIQNIMNNIANRGQKQLDLFTTIAQRVENFYQTHDVANGKTLSNYQTLVDAVTTAQTAAQTAVTNIQNTSVQFKCDGTDPKGAAASFKTALKSEIQALKAYRTAVKNLIVGVKSLTSTTTGDNSTTSNTNGGNQ